MCESALAKARTRSLPSWHTRDRAPGPRPWACTTRPARYVPLPSQEGARRVALAQRVSSRPSHFLHLSSGPQRSASRHTLGIRMRTFRLLAKLKKKKKNICKLTKASPQVCQNTMQVRCRAPALVSSSRGSACHAFGGRLQGQSAPSWHEQHGCLNDCGG